MGQFRDVFLGEKSLEITETLYVFDDERRMLRGAGENLFEPLLARADDVEQEVLSLWADGIHDVIDVDAPVRFPIRHAQCKMVQARAVVAHKIFGRRWQAKQMVDEVRMIRGGKNLGRTAVYVCAMHAFGNVGGGVLVGDVVGAPVVIAG